MAKKSIEYRRLRIGWFVVSIFLWVVQTLIKASGGMSFLLFQSVPFLAALLCLYYAARLHKAEAGKETEWKKKHASLLKRIGWIGIGLLVRLIPVGCYSWMVYEGRFAWAIPALFFMLEGIVLWLTATARRIARNL